MIEREQWGARPSTRTLVRRSLWDVGFQVVHWSATAPPRKHHSCDRTVRAIQAFHQDTRGWADIAYHRLVCPHGRVYEGRPIETIGAHVKGRNTVSVGYCVITDRRPTEAAFQALATVLAEDRGNLPNDVVKLRVHDDFGDTECPGSALTQWVRDVVAWTNGP